MHLNSSPKSQHNSQKPHVPSLPHISNWPVLIEPCQWVQSMLDALHAALPETCVEHLQGKLHQSQQDVVAWRVLVSNFEDQLSMLKFLQGMGSDEQRDHHFVVESGRRVVPDNSGPEELIIRE